MKFFFSAVLTYSKNCDNFKTPVTHRYLLNSTSGRNTDSILAFTNYFCGRTSFSCYGMYNNYAANIKLNLRYILSKRRCSFALLYIIPHCHLFKER